MSEPYIDAKNKNKNKNKKKKFQKPIDKGIKRVYNYDESLFSSIKEVGYEGIYFSIGTGYCS